MENVQVHVGDLRALDYPRAERVRKRAQETVTDVATAKACPRGQKRITQYLTDLARRNFKPGTQAGASDHASMMSTCQPSTHPTYTLSIRRAKV